MMFAGGTGLAHVAVGTPVAFFAGALLVFTAGWGWTGLLLATTIRLLPGHAATAGRSVQVGLYSGAAPAPYAFGTLSAAAGYPAAALGAAVTALATAPILVGARRLRRPAEAAPASCALAVP